MLLNTICKLIGAKLRPLHVQGSLSRAAIRCAGRGHAVYPYPKKPMAPPSISKSCLPRGIESSTARAMLEPNGNLNPGCVIPSFTDTKSLARTKQLNSGFHMQQFLWILTIPNALGNEATARPNQALFCDNSRLLPHETLVKVKNPVADSYI